MKGKKSFIFYSNWREIFAQLPDEKAGQLIKFILDYVNDDDPKTDDVLINAVFAGIKNALKDDLKRWEKLKDKKSESGRLGNLKRWNLDLYKKVVSKKITIDEAEKIANDRKVSQCDKVRSQKVANIAVNDNVNVNVNVNGVVNSKYNEETINCFLCCVEFFPAHLHPKTEKQKTTWIETIEKLNRIDKIPFETIEQIVAGIRNDSFWAKNFLAIPKLRKTNKDGVKYVVVFHEHLKNANNGKINTTATAEIRRNNPNI